MDWLPTVRALGRGWVSKHGQWSGRLCRPDGLSPPAPGAHSTTPGSAGESGDLAEASADDVLAHWSGLGYYARTRSNCSQCPVSSDCEAATSDRVAHYPAPRPRLSITKKTFQMLILIDENGNVLLERRPPVGIWGGLWALPEDENAELIRQRLGIADHVLR